MHRLRRSVRPSLIRLAASRPTLAHHVTPLAAATRQFHASSRRGNEVPKSPFQIFVDVVREELKKDRDLQENMKQLQGDVDKFQDSEAMKKARDAYERARVRTHCSIIHVYSNAYTTLVVDKHQGEPTITRRRRTTEGEWLQGQ